MGASAGTNLTKSTKTQEPIMQAVATPAAESARYARCLEVSRRIRWDMERDVIRGRRFDFQQKFMPDGLSKVGELAFLSAGERRLLGQVQGRTYANMFGMIERYIGAKVVERAQRHALGDQTAFEALIGFTEEELKHQALFRRIEALVAEGMPAGYRFLPQGNDVAGFVLGKSTWAVLALTCHIELFTLAHYRQSIEPDTGLSPLWKDVFFFHMKEESQHAILDELEWRAEDAVTSAEVRDRGVDDLIALVAGIDGMLQLQAGADTEYFAAVCGRALPADQKDAVGRLLLRAYRWQYIVSGAQEARFAETLASLVTPEQQQRIGAALAPLMD